MNRKEIEESIKITEKKIDKINSGIDTTNEFDIDELEEELEFLYEKLEKLEYEEEDD